MIYSPIMKIFSGLFLAIAGLMVGLSHPYSRIAAAPNSTTDLAVYSDGLTAGWEDWSWDTTVNLTAASPVHTGSASVSVKFNQPWAGLYLHSDTPIDTSNYSALRFWVHGGSSGGQAVAVSVNDNGSTVAITPQANTWNQVTIALANLGSPASISDIYWQDSSGGAQPVFYLDDITFVYSNLPTPPPGTGPALSVDAAAGRHAISPYIYGMNFASQASASALNLPVDRWGGNSTSRYNWQNDTTNTGSDWYFENVPDAAGAADAFVDQDRLTGTKTLMTVPLIGWVAKSRPSGHPYDCGFKITKYGSQQGNDSQWDPNCGNGILTNGNPVTGNDPLDTSIAITPAFVTGWINHLTEKYGSAASGGVMFYDLDNEPMLWNSTHRDVHPSPTTYNELRDKTWAYAAAIKAADPSAQTLGPVLWGWCAYLYSALDGCSPGTDYSSHGNVNFVPWYLQQMQAYEQQHGVRILDYLDLHYYPQANGVTLSTAGNATTQALRLRSTRSLWDPSYVDESWINQAVDLIPRMKGWVANAYPGTKLAISEYNWGGLESINGALAQADVLGIFGREGLDLATLWSPPAISDPGMFAFRMYRNYDGQGSAFGETSLQAASANQDQLAIYAAGRVGDGALSMMVINKTAQALTSSLALAHFSPGSSAQVYRYSSANLTAIIRAADQPVTAGGFSATFPANSITLIVIPPGTAFSHFIYLPLIMQP